MPLISYRISRCTVRTSPSLNWCQNPLKCRRKTGSLDYQQQLREPWSFGALVIPSGPGTMPPMVSFLRTDSVPIFQYSYRKFKTGTEESLVTCTGSGAPCWEAYGGNSFCASFKFATQEPLDAPIRSCWRGSNLSDMTGRTFREPRPFLRLPISS